MQESIHLADALNQLLPMDRDAAISYEQAARWENFLDFKARWLNFQRDHENHIQNLKTAIEELEGVPQSLEPPLSKLFFNDNFVSILSPCSTETILRALFSNEEYSNYLYESVLKESLPENVRRLLSQHREEEREHLAYLESALKSVPQRELKIMGQ